MPNFGQKHDLQYLEKYAMLSWDSNSLCGRTVYFTIFKVIFAYAVKVSSNYFSLIMVIHDISKQIEQRVYR